MSERSETRTFDLGRDRELRTTVRWRERSALLSDRDRQELGESGCRIVAAILSPGIELEFPHAPIGKILRIHRSAPAGVAGLRMNEALLRRARLAGLIGGALRDYAPRPEVEMDVFHRLARSTALRYVQTSRLRAAVRSGR